MHMLGLFELTLSPVRVQTLKFSTHGSLLWVNQRVVWWYSWNTSTEQMFEQGRWLFVTLLIHYFICVAALTRISCRFSDFGFVNPKATRNGKKMFETKDGKWEVKREEKIFLQPTPTRLWQIGKPHFSFGGKYGKIHVQDLSSLVSNWIATAAVFFWLWTKRIVHIHRRFDFLFCLLVWHLNLRLKSIPEIDVGE